jgi:sugar/nucleoside kinase (ribokinase family)
VFCTWGEDGAGYCILDTDTTRTVPAMKITEIVDSVGAGDTFIACVIQGLAGRGKLKPEGVDKVMYTSMAICARKIQKEGFQDIVQRTM